jgi:hypothetical protein
MKTITMTQQQQRQNGTFTQAEQGHTIVLKLLWGVALTLGSRAAAPVSSEGDIELENISLGCHGKEFLSNQKKSFVISCWL